jgi:DNA (cytosine-5)-methyltransferase 1
LEDQHVNAGCPLFVPAQTFSIPAIGHIVQDDVASTMTRHTGSGAGETQNPAFVAQPVVVHGTQDPCVSDIAFAQGRNNGGENVLVHPISIHPHCIGRAPEAGPQGKEYLLDGSAYCMDSRGQPQAVAQPIPLNSMNCFRSPESDPTTGCGIGDAGEAMFTITKGQHHAVAAPPAMAVRRLTPVECERLQGFPDGYTNIPWRKKDESPDGPRYKALGNSWAVPNVRWIGKRIQEQINAS